jgi:cyclopropane fatty-acyl-phospholipid synthase-like methyltransferase
VKKLKEAIPPKTMEEIDNEVSVVDYYDANTRRFLKFGQGGDTYSIHRAVWGPGVKTRRHAFQYVNQLLLEQAETAGADVILDLGCGVGGSIRYLADRISSRLYGVTISAVQAGIGKKVLKDAGINDRCSVFHGDFLEREFYRNAGIYNNSVNLAYAVESFNHCSEPEKFFNRMESVITRGGALAVCDDFLKSEMGVLGKRERRLVENYRKGWHIHTLITLKDMDSLAERNGFRRASKLDLSPFLELDRQRDRLIRIILIAARLFPFRILSPGSTWLSNLKGGNALQLCLKRRIIGYYFTLYVHG